MTKPNRQCETEVVIAQFLPLQPNTLKPEINQDKRTFSNVEWEGLVNLKLFLESSNVSIIFNH
jgi:hypothetical protein